jgi:hypothetical protein
MKHYIETHFISLMIGFEKFNKFTAGRIAVAFYH